MRNRLRGSILAGVAVLAISPVLFAQTAQQSGAATQDLSGMWERIDSQTDSRRFSLQEPPLQPWAMEIFKANRGGATDPNMNGVDELDPRNNCFPSGVPRIMISGNALFRIIHLPGQVLILYEQDHWVRQIYVDGREHPEGFPPSWMGHSIGRWDGDTLVVDTVALTDRKWIDRIGTPHSDALHVVERYRRTDHDSLEVEFWFEDTKAFTKPWGGKKVYQLRPNMEILESVTCDHLYVVEQKPGVRPRFEWESLDPNR